MSEDTARARPYQNNLKSLIKRSGYKVIEVADELSIPRSTLYDYISGNRPMPREFLRALAAFLGCELSDIYYVQVADPLRASGNAKRTLPGSDDAEGPLVDEDVSGVAESASGAFALIPPKFDISSTDYDYVAWFGIKLAHLFTLITHGEGGVSRYHDLQARLNKEIMMFDAMKPHVPGEAFTLSRRQAILAIAALPVALLAARPHEHWSVLLKEEFLSRCAASITACWHLMAGREFTEVERALSAYLPVLLSWAQQSSPQQKTIANLAAQGNILMSLVALHTYRPPRNVQGRLTYCRQAVDYAKVSGDRTLHVVALMHLGGNLGEATQPVESLQHHLEATQYLKDVSPLVQSKIYIELARTYSWNGQVQEALRCIGEARATLPEEQVFVPIFLSGNSGLYHLLWMEGQTRLTLGDQQSNSTYYDQAGKLFGQIEALPSTVVIPERIRVEIINQRALAAVKVQDLDLFCDYLEQGIQGAQALASEQRRQEAISIYWAGRKLWPHEVRVKELSDLFIRLN